MEMNKETIEKENLQLILDAKNAIDALANISAICENQEECSECPFYTKQGCMLRITPRKWHICKMELDTYAKMPAFIGRAKNTLNMFAAIVNELLEIRHERFEEAPESENRILED